MCLKDEYQELIGASFGDVDQFNTVMDELLLEKKEQFNTIKQMHSNNNSEKGDDDDDDDDEKEQPPESSSFEEVEFVEKIVTELENFLIKNKGKRL